MKDHKILIVLAVILVVTLYFSDFTNITGSAIVSKCSDGIDNDDDGFTDSDDVGCADGKGGERTRCQDGNDNDKDGQTDLADTGCFGIQDDHEKCEANSECNIDCISGESPACSTKGDCYCKTNPTTSTTTQCSDSQDNDGDNFIDLLDTGCTSLTDDTETCQANSECAITQECPTIETPTCSPSGDCYCSPDPVIYECDDNLDNDNDNFIDLADTGCTSATDDTETCQTNSECSIDCISGKTSRCSTNGDCECVPSSLPIPPPSIPNNICEVIETSAGEPAICSSGYTIMGGGWVGSIGTYGKPQNNGFYCEDDSSSSKCYAVCCDSNYVESTTVSKTSRLDYGIKTYCPSGYEVVGGGFEDVLIGNGLASNTLTPGGDQDSLSPLNDNGWYCQDDASNVQGSSCYAVCAKSTTVSSVLNCTTEVKTANIISGVYLTDISSTYVSCPSDYFLTGGGFVDRSTSNDDQDISQPVGNSWFVQEDFDDVTAVPNIAYARCCKFDSTNELPVCGNGEINNGEICDTNELNGLECSDFDEFEEGDLKCNTQCHLDTSDCIPFDPDPNSYCGDNNINPGEECEPGNPDILNDFTCNDFGFSSGSLECYSSGQTNECFFDTSDCSTSDVGDDPICGNDIKESEEQCDGSDLNDFTCEDLGYDSGILSCDSDCKYDRFDCSSTISEGDCSWSCNPLLPSTCPSSQQQEKTCSFIGQTYSGSCSDLIKEDCAVSYTPSTETATVTCSCIQETEIPVFTFFNIILTVLLLTSYYFFKRKSF